jgi:hypothetical protein
MLQAYTPHRPPIHNLSHTDSSGTGQLKLYANDLHVFFQDHGRTTTSTNINQLQQFCDAVLMGDGRTEVVLLWETRAMSEQNLLVSAGSVPAGSAPAPNKFPATSFSRNLLT